MKDRIWTTIPGFLHNKRHSIENSMKEKNMEQGIGGCDTPNIEEEIPETTGNSKCKQGLDRLREIRKEIPETTFIVEVTRHDSKSVRNQMEI